MQYRLGTHHIYKQNVFIDTCSAVIYLHRNLYCFTSIKSCGEFEKGLVSSSPQNWQWDLIIMNNAFMILYPANTIR